MKMLISMVLTLGVVLFASQYMLKGMGGFPVLAVHPSPPAVA